MMVKAMDERLGEGEIKLRDKRRRLYVVLGALMAVGFVTGFGLAFAEEEGSDWLSGRIPAWVALLLAGVWLASMIVGKIWFFRNVDELEVRINVWAMAASGSAVLIGYPVWWLLWRGGMVEEPSAHIMFGALYAVAILAYLWKKYR